MKPVRFIDLFAGIGGLRLGFEQGLARCGLQAECVMTSEIKPHALKVLHHNFDHDHFVGDITRVSNKDIPDFDFLLGGFPCQPFSAGGKRLGFVDTRGTLFFEIERIIDEKRPMGFILENVEGLVRHDLESPKDRIGRTLRVILERLSEMGYQVAWNVLNSEDFGLPQTRKRVFIVGFLQEKVDLNGFDVVKAKVGDILEKGLPTMQTKFAERLLEIYPGKELWGKSIKDKRGGENNIHSWDLELKGPVSDEQKKLLNKLFKERRKKKWAAEHGIPWMDGMTLTLEQIRSFHDVPHLEDMLNDLVKKGYLKKESPKVLVREQTLLGEKAYRMEDKTKAKRIQHRDRQTEF
jgi:DNA-methyltransferase (dcm)